MAVGSACVVGSHPMVRMCSSNELDVDQDLPVVPGTATGTEVGPLYQVEVFCHNGDCHDVCYRVCHINWFSSSLLTLLFLLCLPPHSTLTPPSFSYSLHLFTSSSLLFSVVSSPSPPVSPICGAPSRLTLGPSLTNHAV